MSAITIAREVVPLGVETIVVCSQSGAESGIRFWKNDLPGRAVGEALQQRRPIADRAHERLADGDVVAGEVELGLAVLREHHLARAGDRDRATARVQLQGWRFRCHPRGRYRVASVETPEGRVSTRLRAGWSIETRWHPRPRTPLPSARRPARCAGPARRRSCGPARRARRGAHGRPRPVRGGLPGPRDLRGEHGPHRPRALRRPVGGGRRRRLPAAVRRRRHRRGPRSPSDDRVSARSGGGGRPRGRTKLGHRRCRRDGAPERPAHRADGRHQPGGRDDSLAPPAPGRGHRGARRIACRVRAQPEPTVGREVPGGASPLAARGPRAAVRRRPARRAGAGRVGPGGPGRPARDRGGGGRPRLPHVLHEARPTAGRRALRRLGLRQELLHAGAAAPHRRDHAGAARQGDAAAGLLPVGRPDRVQRLALRGGEPLGQPRRAHLQEPSPPCR